VADRPEIEHRWVRRALSAHARPGRSAALQDYVGSPLPTLAVPAPDLHRIVGEFRRRNGPRTSAELRPLLERLWSGATFEERIVAIELLDRYVEAHDRAAWRLAGSWVDEATGWGLSDSLAAGPIARMVADEPRRFSDVLRWTRSRNLWRRRASTYALHDLVLDSDLDRPFILLRRLEADPEFWVQRAVGTWLRECWKKDARRTERFLRDRAHMIATVALTVATERAPRSLRAELRAARVASRRPPGRGHPHMRRAR
jgi:3-methyladenine DNA glycosylase AlkD